MTEKHQFTRKPPESIEELHDAYARCSAVLEGVSEGILIAEVSSLMIRYENPSICRMLGYSPEELERMSIREIHPESDWPHILSEFQAQARRERSLAVNIPCRRKDGTIIYADITTTPVLFDGVECNVGFFHDVTDRRQMEEVLRKRGTQLRVTLESTADGILAVDNTGKVVQANRRFAALWRIPPSLMERGDDRAMLDFVLGQLIDPDAFLKKVQLLYHSDAEDMDTLLFKDGRVLERYSVPMIEEGVRVGRVWSFHDVTERKRLEDRLRDSEERFRALVEQSLTGICIIHEDKFVYVNPRLAEMLDCPEAEMIGRSPLDFVVEADRERVRANLLKRMKGEVRSAHYQFHVRRRDGTDACLEVFGGVMVFSGKLAIMGTVQDVTARQRAEEDLRHLQDLLNQTQVLSKVGGWEYDVTTRRNVWTDEVYHIYGVEPSAFDPNDIPRVAAFFAPEDRDTVVEAFRRAIETGDPYDMEVRFINARGERLWVRVVGRAERRDGRIVRVYGNVMDITEGRRAEEAIRTLSHRLSQAQDEERRRVARELHDSVAQQLAAVTMNLGMIEDLQRSKSVKIRGLLRDSLDLVEQCSQEVRTVSYLLHPPLLDQLGLAAALRSYVEGFSGRSGIRVAVEAPGDLGRFPPEVELALFRVVQESLGNVHRHSGSSVARVRLMRQPGRLVVEVTDEGHGMPPDVLRSVQAGGAATGMGIASMRERLRQLGEDVHIESGSHGTTIRATIGLTGMDT